MAEEKLKREITTKDIFLLYFWKLLCRVIILPFYALDLFTRFLVLAFRGELISEAVREHEVTQASLLIIRFALKCLIKILGQILKLLWSGLIKSMPREIYLLSCFVFKWFGKRKPFSSILTDF